MDSPTKSTIGDLKLKHATSASQSLRKCLLTIHCAVLTKSELRTTKYGHMFTMTLCDENTSSTIKAVSFEKDVYESYQPKSTYNLQNFKIKKGMGGDIEIHVNASTNVTLTQHQFKIEANHFTIAQIIRGETENVRYLQLKCKVLSVDDVELVGKYPDRKEKRELILGDETGHVRLVLWCERAKESSLKQDDTVLIENAIKTTYNGAILITATNDTVIKAINEDIQVTAPPMKKKRCTIVNEHSGVISIKDFKACLKCFNPDCREEIPNTEEMLTTCPTCGAMFMKQQAVLQNECMFLLSANEEWFSARATVRYICLTNAIQVEAMKMINMHAWILNVLAPIARSNMEVFFLPNLIIVVRLVYGRV